jgi:hypothetical protein
MIANGGGETRQIQKRKNAFVWSELQSFYHSNGLDRCCGAAKEIPGFFAALRMTDCDF